MEFFNIELNKASGNSSTDSGEEIVKEYVVRLPKVNHKHYSLMKFNSPKTDASEWIHPKMEREDNSKMFRTDEDYPKYGAGSEFGREQKDAARRKRYGNTKMYNPNDQPWILKHGEKDGKRFKGTREGGVAENTSYYVFTKASDGTIEAFPIEEWYKFSPFPCYKTLNAEEAEVEFKRRDTCLNYYKIMHKNKQKVEVEDVNEDESQDSGRFSRLLSGMELKISDADDWIDFSHDFDEPHSGDDNEDEKSKKKESSKKTEKKKSAEKEVFEENYEGYFDDREVDYITDFLSSEEELEDETADRQNEGVEEEEEDALRKIYVSGDEDEEEVKETEANPKTKGIAPELEQEKETNSSDGSSESDNSAFDDSKIQSAMFMQNRRKKNDNSEKSVSSSSSINPVNSDGDKQSPKSSQKRKLEDASHASVSKQTKLDIQSSAPGNSNPSSENDITEDNIRRYLSRKPRTAKNLLQKFKKKTVIEPEKLTCKIVSILKKVKPYQKKIKNKLHFSLKK